MKGDPLETKKFEKKVAQCRKKLKPYSLVLFCILRMKQFFYFCKTHGVKVAFKISSVHKKNHFNLDLDECPSKELRADLRKRCDQYLERAEKIRTYLRDKNNEKKQKPIKNGESRNNRTSENDDNDDESKMFQVRMKLLRNIRFKEHPIFFYIFRPYSLWKEKVFVSLVFAKFCYAPIL